MQHALAIVKQEDGGLESCTPALSALRADVVLNTDSLFDKPTLGTLRDWVEDLGSYYDGDVAHLPNRIRPDSKTIHALCTFSSGKLYIKNQ